MARITIPRKGDDLLPLLELLTILDPTVGQEYDGVWRVAEGAYGYGDFIGSLEDALESRDVMDVGNEDLIRALRSGEFFDNVRLSTEDGAIQVALIDSNSLYAVVPPDLGVQLLERFPTAEMTAG